MLRYSIAALFGAYSTLALVDLPSIALLFVSGMVAVALVMYRRSCLVGVYVLGFVGMSFASHQELVSRLRPELHGVDIQLSVHVIEIQGYSAQNYRFSASPEDASEFPPLIRLSWFNPPLTPLPGEQWQLKVRLKRPRGFSNPGGFDFEGWLFREGVGATGYVVDDEHNRLLETSTDAGMAGLRRRMDKRLDALLAPGDARAVIKAITLGDRSEITAEQWLVYARTGTSHLMAISGLHIGLAAGGTYALVWILFGQLGRFRRLRDIAMLASVLAAFAYADLSGFAIPARRAFVMIVLSAIAVLMRRRLVPEHVLASACVLVAIDEPLSIFSPGFQLSFAAVGLLVWWSKRLPCRADGGPRWHPSSIFVAARELLHLQVLFLFGLMLITVWIFGRVTIAAPLINFIVLPVFSLIIVPCGLLGLMLDGAAAIAGDALLVVSARATSLLLQCLQAASGESIVAIDAPISGWTIILLAGPTILLALLPAGWPGRKLALMAAFATVFSRHAAVPERCLDVAVLDVGQGLAVVLATATQTTVFDTGPGYRSGSSAANLVILPYLKSIGVSRIDTLIVSHGDLDHSGGLSDLRRSLSVNRLLSGEPALTGGIQCRSGMTWESDGVRFSIEHPGDGERWEGNNASCVLLIETGDYRVLIPGDIEAEAERDLLSHYQAGSVDLLVIPHHGSRTSSQRAFVNATQPHVAVAASGHRNRWGFPKPEITERWQRVGSIVLTTSESGAIRQRFCPDQTPQAPRQYRIEKRRIWHDRSDTTKPQNPQQ